MNQAIFFAETKKVNTKMALTKDKYEEQTYEVNTDFMVYLKDKTQLGNNDNLYSGSLVILKSKMTTKDKEYELPSFDIRDEKKERILKIIQMVHNILLDISHFMKMVR